MPQTDKNTADDTFSALPLPGKVLEHVVLADTAMQKAAAAEKRAQAREAAVAERIPAVVDALVKYDRIRPEQAEKCAEMLRDPVQVLELMQKLAGHRNAEEASRLGAGIKLAGAGAAVRQPEESPFVGGPRLKTRASDLALFRGLGLSDPTDD